jgi:putative membrane protein
VGIGAIVPGFFGGVLAVVLWDLRTADPLFGEPAGEILGERALFPAGRDRRDRWGGGVLGGGGFMRFTYFPAQFTWLFIGFIAGTFPSLLKTSGKEGRKSWHWGCGGNDGGDLFLHALDGTIHNVTMEPNIWSWLLSGALMGLGMVVPGMSPSNFLIYLGLYQPHGQPGSAS